MRKGSVYAQYRYNHLSLIVSHHHHHDHQQHELSLLLLLYPQLMETGTRGLMDPGSLTISKESQGKVSHLH